VLLAEDNLINQDVAKAMLEVIGARTTVVSDGREVLAALGSGRFDLILMDCQMPGMDGYEATARVRARERGTGGHIPIIALTANAVAGDAEQCIAAGMDDYLSKPFSQRELAELVARWAPAASADPPPAVDAPPAPAQEDAGTAERGVDVSINPRALESIRLLASGLLERVVGQYVVDAPRYLDQIRAAVAADEPETLRRAAHALKSSSANLGAERFAAICQGLETLGRSGTTQGGAARLADAQREYERVCVALNSAIAPATQSP
jgi:CheY-like chemotaxis protein/HPt (histidine-containing phosphotransfer) domain-containing protein